MGGRGASSGRASGGGGATGTKVGEGFTISMGKRDVTFFIDARRVRY